MTRDDVTRRREAARRYAARRRAAALERANARSRTCQRRQGPGVCGGLLEDRVDRARGTVVRECPRCARRLAGLCRDCPRPVEGTRGRAIRCASCKARAQQAAHERFVARHADRLREKARAAYQDPAVRARRNTYKRLYRQARREQVRREKRRAALRHNAARERMLAYHRKYNAARRSAKAEAQRLRERELTPAPQPICVGCARPIPGYDHRPECMENVGRPPTRCVFCLTPAALRASVQRWIARTDRELATPAPPPRRVRPWRPRQKPTRRTPTGARLCWNDHCERVVSGREKKCPDCRAREARDAAAALAAHRGRGRRTDLGRAA